jgi:D-3-phosphoglycerate dehydrogenase/(S)-sulfolactate dehydrogenase
MARCLVTTIFANSPDDPALAPLVQAGHVVEIADPLAIGTEADLATALQGVAATIASVEPYTAAVLARADALRVISRTGVGYDAVDVPAATRRGVVVCTTPGANHHAVADLALGLILTCARGIVAGDRSLRDGRWLPDYPSVELRGMTVGVIGTGLIGSEVVKRLYGFEPRVIASDIVQSRQLVERFGLEYVSFEQLLEQSDFVTIHAPLLPETRHLIDAAALARMKPTAYLVNTARGPLVDESALVEALQRGRLGGAALDVFHTEPLPMASPLRTAPRLVLTPHMAGTTAQSAAAMMHMAVENAVRVLRGERPLSCVNPEALDRVA